MPHTDHKANAGGTGVGSRIVYATGGQVIYSLGQLGILSALSLMRGAEATGMFGLAMSIVTPVFILANMGLRTVQSVDQEQAFQMREYIAFRILNIVLALAICIAAASVLTQHPTVQLIVLLFAGAKAFESISEIAYGAFAREERVELVFRSYLVRSVLTLLVFVALLFAGAPVWAAFLAQLVVWALAAFALDMPALVRLVGPDVDLRPSISRAQIWRLYRRAIPIGGTSFLSGVQLSLLRIFVEAHMGLAALGVFTNISYIFHAGAMLSNSVRQVLGARFARLRQTADMAATWRVIRFVLGLLALAFAIGFAVVIFAGAPLLLTLFGPETALETDLLFVVCCALVFRMLSAVPMSLIYAYGGTVGQMIRELVFVVCVVVLSMMLVPAAGLLGAGFVLLAVSMLRLLGDGARVAHRWHMRKQRAPVTTNERVIRSCE